VAPLDVNARVLEQNGTSLYLFAMNSRQLDKISYVTPRSKDDPKEVQRLLSKKRTKEIGEFIKKPDSLLPTAIVLNLTDSVTITRTGNRDSVTLGFPNAEPAEDEKYAYVLDGQHRLKGFDFSDGIEFDLPIVAVHNANDTMRAKIFADINSKQVKVSKVQLAALHYQYGLAEDADEDLAMRVVEKLTTDTGSPLEGRVKMFDDQTDTWIANYKLADFIKSHITSGGKLYGRPIAEQSKILEAYFAALQLTWPDAWGSKNHRLTAPLGLEVLLDVFPEVKHRVDLHHAGQYTAANFASMMEPLQGADVALAANIEVELTWEKGTLQFAANQAGRTTLESRMKDLLNEADP
jgi:DGQHR domain-containing protein